MVKKISIHDFFPAWHRQLIGVSVSVLTSSLFWGIDGLQETPVHAAEVPTTPPPAELVNLIQDIETAADRQDIQTVMASYSPDFTNSDGLNHQGLEQALTQFWQNYTGIDYQTQLQSWEQEGSELIATTVTQISATQDIGGREFKLTSSITSKQRIEDQKIVQQEILAEATQVRAGDQPPTVTFNVPEEVKVGGDFNVDAIVEEPLGDEVLLGTALEEPVRTRGYFAPSPFQLEFLASGGLFKVGTAPQNPQTNWISAVLIRRGGITLVTQRLRVVEN
ncbi:MAG: nuclear transport factor 2 family protein [Oscillatoriales cyanobacterium RM2_1_1]|nr:nuclear transport factor 2 family protein [Oscillatoriales cyanobacterium SM2_3_0]NJO47908.1 nuclear transport factor 2 family protein [Oscillatoriales cyanobacterium RM2_1_1]